MPIIGEMTMNISVFAHPDQIKTPVLPEIPPSTIARAMAAPAYPPNRACEELVGRPSHHVRRSQAMAPSSPHRMTYTVTIFRSTRPEPTVFATPVPKLTADTKLKKAAQTTACRGVSTRVATTVAIELAASWNPLTKS